jgi:hypothetical protein
MFVNQVQKGDSTMGRVMIRALALLAFLGMWAEPSLAGSEQRKGTSGAHELQIPVGARGSALGGAAVSDPAGIEAVYWNPAGLAELEGTEVLFTNTRYFAGQDINFATVGTKVGGLGVLAVNAKVLSIGEVIVTTEDAPEGTGEIIEPTFTVMGISLARQFTDRVRAGGTVNFVNERILSTSAGGVAFDFGVQYLTGWRGLKLGMVMKNFGSSMEFDGENFDTSLLPPDSDPTSSQRTFRSTSAAFELPSYFNLSATYDIMSNATHRLATLGAFQNNNFSGDNVVAAVEWGYKDTFAVRGSWFGSIISLSDPLTGQDTGEFKGGDDLYDGFAIGAGAKVKAGDARLSVDVVYKPVKEFFDDIVEFGLKLKF